MTGTACASLSAASARTSRRGARAAVAAAGLLLPNGVLRALLRVSDPACSMLAVHGAGRDFERLLLAAAKMLLEQKRRLQGASGAGLWLLDA